MHGNCAAEPASGDYAISDSENAPSGDQAIVQHNLVGQRLGRKGRQTRERILIAAERLIDDPEQKPLSLSAVAREASVVMTTLYIYFADLGELLLAVLERAMGDEDSFLKLLKTRWSDYELGTRCVEFIGAHQAFFSRHARILFLRNSFADEGDARFVEMRVAWSHPQIEALVRQMDGDPEGPEDSRFSTAVALLTGIERLTTVVTMQKLNPGTRAKPALPFELITKRQLYAQARILELAIRDQRTNARHY
jgi:AcrR family transcriptional regulator